MDLIKTLELFLGLSLCGLVALIYGALRAHWFRRKLDRETEETEARIVSYKMKYVTEGKYRYRKDYFPLLAFHANGGEVQIQSKEELKPEEHPVGSIVRLWFDPYDPRHLHITEDDNDLGHGMIRLGWFFVGGAAIVTVVISLALGWL